MNAKEEVKFKQGEKIRKYIYRKNILNLLQHSFISTYLNISFQYLSIHSNTFIACYIICTDILSGSINYFHCLGLAWSDWFRGWRNQFHSIRIVRLLCWWWMTTVTGAGPPTWNPPPPTTDLGSNNLVYLL